MLLRDHFSRIQSFLELTPKLPHLIIAPPGRAVILSELLSPCQVLLPTAEAVRTFQRLRPNILTKKYTEFIPQAGQTFLVEVLHPGAEDADLMALLSTWQQNPPIGSKLILLASIKLPVWPYPYYEVVTELFTPDERISPPHGEAELYQLLFNYHTSDLPGAFLVYVATAVEVKSLQDRIHHVPELQNRVINIVTPWTDLEPTTQYSLVLDTGLIQTRTRNFMGGTRIQIQPIAQLLSSAHQKLARAIYHLLAVPRMEVIVPPKGLLSPPLQTIWNRALETLHDLESVAAILALIDSYGPYFVYPEFKTDSEERTVQIDRWRKRYFDRWRGISDIDTVVAMWQQAQREILAPHDMTYVQKWAQDNSVDPVKLNDAIETMVQLGRSIGRRDVVASPTQNILWELRPLFKDVYREKLLTPWLENQRGEDTPSSSDPSGVKSIPNGMVYYDASFSREYYIESQFSVNEFGRVIPLQLIPFVQTKGQMGNSIDFALDTGIRPVKKELPEATEGY